MKKSRNILHKASDILTAAAASGSGSDTGLNNGRKSAADVNGDSTSKVGNFQRLPLKLLTFLYFRPMCGIMEEDRL